MGLNRPNAGRSACLGLHHRYELLDAFIHHYSDWWLVGTPNTESWGWLTDGAAKGFCVVCKHAGPIGRILFIRTVVIGFREVGRRNLVNDNYSFPLATIIICQ